MAAIGLLAKDNADRELLGLMLGELGHSVEGSGRLEEAVEFARERKTRAFLLVDGGGADAESLTRELKTPLVVADAILAQIGRGQPLDLVALPVKLRDHGECELRGRTGAIHIWSLAD